MCEKQVQQYKKIKAVCFYWDDNNGTFLDAAKKAKKFTNPLWARNKKLGGYVKSLCISIYIR